jgi:hypothetical protein
MSVILALDVATVTGWSLFDTETTYSQIKLGKFRCEGKEIWEKAASLRDNIREIRKAHNRIDFGVIEMPLTISPQYQKKEREDFASGADQANRGDGAAFIERISTAIQRHGLASREVADVIGETFASPTINSMTTAQLNWLAGVAQTTLLGMGIPVEIVRAQSWQAVIPKEIRNAMKKGNGRRDTKAAVRVYCDRLGIIGGDENARDAAMIGIWCSLKSQMFKEATKERTLL